MSDGRTRGPGPSPAPSPVDIGLDPAKDALTVTWDDGGVFSIPAELLRVESPSAEVQGHGPEEKTTPAGKRGVLITEVVPVGNYAVRLAFSDGHATGIYSWETLRRYGLEADRMMAEYLERLEALGLSRDG